jgi:hypothetical protein
LFVSSWRGKVQLSWNQIDKLQATPNFFGGYIVTVYRTDGGRFLGLPCALFANGNFLTKAIFEAAYKANPHVELSGWVFLNAEGHPPYGIFPDPEPTSASHTASEAEVRDREARSTS